MEIDLNADLAEGLGAWRMGDDEALLDVLSSANLACGFHAGDPLIMKRRSSWPWREASTSAPMSAFPTARASVGDLQIDAAELAAMVIYQLGALDGITRSPGGRMKHMSFHGALGNVVAADPELAEILVRAIADFNPQLVILSSSSRAIETAAADCGLRVARRSCRPGLRRRWPARGSQRKPLAPSSTTRRRARARPTNAENGRGCHL